MRKACAASRVCKQTYQAHIAADVDALVHQPVAALHSQEPCEELRLPRGVVSREPLDHVCQRPHVAAWRVCRAQTVQPTACRFATSYMTPHMLAGQEVVECESPKPSGFKPPLNG